MRVGDRVLLSTPLATRDPADVEQADGIVLDREVTGTSRWGQPPSLSRFPSGPAGVADRTRGAASRIPDFRLQDGAEIAGTAAGHSASTACRSAGRHEASQPLPDRRFPRSRDRCVPKHRAGGGC